MGRPPGSRNKPKPPAAGHNSIDRDKLRELIERIEELEVGRAELSEGVKEIYAEAKSLGFDTGAIRKVVRIRRDEGKHDERQATIDAYLHALGTLADTPLGQAAVQREFGGEPRPF